MAGESAEQLAQRQRERAERLMRSAERYERGAQGERDTGVILDGLRDEGWVTYHDVRWPGRVRANLDHVIVGPGGIFVIDSKNWSGRIEVRENTFWCHGRRQDKTVAAAGDAALAVAGIVSAPAAGTVRSALCFVRDEPVAGWCYDVMVCSTVNLREMLVTRPVVLTPDQVRLAAIELDLGFRAAAQTRAVHSPVSRAPRPPVVGKSRAKREPTFWRRLFGLIVIVMAAVFAATLLPGLITSAVHELTDDFAPVATYEDCKALRADHPHGAGTSEAVNALQRERRIPVADDRLFDANSSLDRDGDGIVCERGR